MVKHKQWLLALMVLCLLLSACGKSPSPESGKADTPTGAPSETGADSVPVSDDAAPALRTLSCLADAGTIQFILPGASDEALFLCMADGADTEVTLYRVDLTGDTVLAQCGTEGSWPIGWRANGEIVAVHYGRQVLTTYGEDLRPVAEIPFVGNKVVYCPGEDALYVLDNHTLTRMDFSGQTEPLFSCQNGARVTDINPTTGEVLVTGLPADDGASFAYRVYAPDGTKRFSTESAADLIGFTASGIALQHYGGGDGGDTLELFDGKNGWSGRAYILGSGKVVYPFADAPLMGIVEDSFSDPAGGWATAVSVLELPSGEVREIKRYDAHRQVTFAWMREAERLLIGVSGDGGAEVLLADPAALSVEEQLSPAALSVLSPEPLAPTPEHLADLREQADRLEQTYGVRILFGDQALQPPTDGTYTARSTAWFAPEEETALVEQALRELEAALSSYPDGFFEKFRNDEGAAGVRFLLVTGIAPRDSNSSFMPNAVMYTTGGWYNIQAMTDGLTRSTLHHELWHAVENRLEADDIVLAWDRWAELNPEGFTYNYDLDHYGSQADSPYLLGAVDHDIVYFTSTYSTVNVNEDRATLIQYLLQDGEDVAERLAFIRDNYPHLSAKLDYMAQQTAQVFGSAYWQ